MGMFVTKSHRACILVYIWINNLGENTQSLGVKFVYDKTWQDGKDTYTTPLCVNARDTEP